MAILRDPFSTVQIPKPLVELSASLCNDIDGFLEPSKHDAKKTKINHEFPCVLTTKNVPVKQEKRASFQAGKKSRYLPPLTKAHWFWGWNLG